HSLRAAAVAGCVAFAPLLGPTIAAADATPLSAADVQRYERIFELQDRGRWSAADREISRLDDRLLLGHVKAQRYLHPTAWRSKFKDLRDWMRAYRDHPDAARIYRLAMKRRPGGWTAPPKPTTRPLKGFGGDIVERDERYEPTDRRARAQRREARRLRNIARYRLRKGWPTGASEILGSRAARNAFDQGALDQLWGRTAAGFFFAGDDSEAFRVGRAAGQRSPHVAHEANWFAGLAAWRMGRFDDARAAFEAAVRSRGAGGWTKSAAAYWAARANIRVGRPERSSGWLLEAADEPYTLYGQLAADQLGVDPGFDFDRSPATTVDISALTLAPAGRRAAGLLQVGQTHRAEQELRSLWPGASPHRRKAIMAVAMQENMASLSLYLGWDAHRKDGRVFDAALYPEPAFEPNGGFAIDRALLFAIMRQESAFMPHARSHAGARGLMQVMPGTARLVARQRNIGGVKRSTMYDPGLNMQLGQTYIDMLKRERTIPDTLFHIVASYNAGPGNVAKWETRSRHGGDPLLFIEAIPFTETRDYVKKVVSNLWIYRARFGQDAPSLRAVAANAWPQYQPQDGDVAAAARNARY
ncbi:MAG: lytic transglycosylase domain-containing protein, partial [Pseudomonadota bacterium]